MQPENARAIILYTNDDNKQTTIKLRDYNTIFGQDNSDIIVPDENMSSPHFQIQAVEGSWFVFDMNSRFGTYINGTKINEKTLLNHLDKITASKSEFIFQFVDSKEVAHIPSIGKVRL